MIVAAQEIQSYLLAFVASEVRQSEIILRQIQSQGDPVEALKQYKFVRQITNRFEQGAEFYEDLHTNLSKYAENNWLLKYCDWISHLELKHLVELGCGNGKASLRLANSIDQMTCYDWAIPMALKSKNEGISWIDADLTKIDTFPKCDLICSADFLEHLSLQNLVGLIKKMHSSSSAQFHVIACYDDARSHQTIMPPSAWLALFRTVHPSYRLEAIETRRNSPRQIVCVISNLEQHLPDEIQLKSLKLNADADFQEVGTQNLLEKLLHKTKMFNKSS